MSHPILLGVYLAGVGVSAVVGASCYQYEKATSDEKIDKSNFTTFGTVCSILWPGVIAVASLMIASQGAVYLAGLPGIILARRALRLKAQAEEHKRVLAASIPDLIAEAEKNA